MEIGIFLFENEGVVVRINEVCAALSRSWYLFEIIRTSAPAKTRNNVVKSECF